MLEQAVYLGCFEHLEQDEHSKADHRHRCQVNNTTREDIDINVITDSRTIDSVCGWLCE